MPAVRARLYCGVLALLAAQRASGHRLGSYAVLGDGASPADAAGNAWSAEARRFLNGVTGKGWPHLELPNMPRPGARNKRIRQAMHVGLSRMSFSVPGDEAVLSDAREAGPLGVVGKVICVFVNPKSGSRMGSRFLSLGQGADIGRVRELILDVQTGQQRRTMLFGWYGQKAGYQNARMNASTLQVLFFNISDDCSRASGIYALHRLRNVQRERVAGCSAASRAVEGIIGSTQYQPRELDIRVVVAGGDGTVTWLINELHTEATPPVDVPIGTIPLGTGNDLSRQLNTPAGTARCTGAGFLDALTHSDTLASPRGTLEVMAKFSVAPLTFFDVWRVEAVVQPGGDFQQISHGNLGSVGHHCVKKVDGRCEEMRHTMVNYASVGFESIIGLEFEKWRSLRMNNTQLSNKYKYFEIASHFDLGGKSSAAFPFLRYRSLKQFVEEFRDGTAGDDIRAEEASSYGCDPRRPSALGSYKSLMVMNVECVMGGMRKWPRQYPMQPHLDDSRLELLAFRSPLTMGVIDGNLETSCAVGQYSNPTIVFRPNSTIAFQVDGEFYAGIGVETMNVKFSQRILMVRLGKGDKDKIGNPTIRF